MGVSDTLTDHRDLRLIALAFVGGAVGTGARAAIEHEFPFEPGSWPWSTFAINITGAFLLGLLLEALSRREALVGRARRARALLGTGVLGGFTTYSAFALEAVRLPSGLGLLYAVLSAALGVAAAAAGFRLARSRAREPVPEPGS